MRPTPDRPGRLEQRDPAGDVVAVVAGRVRGSTRRPASGRRSGGSPRCARSRAGARAPSASAYVSSRNAAPGRDRRAMAGRQVVEDHDLVAGLDEGRRRDRADIAGPAGHQDPRHVANHTGCGVATSRRPPLTGFGAGAGRGTTGVSAPRESGPVRSRARSPARRPAPVRARSAGPPRPRSRPQAAAARAAVADDLLEPLDHPARGRVLRVDDQGAPGELQRAGLVAALERHAGEAHHRDRVARIGVGDLPVERLGRVDPAHLERPFRLEQDLDHGVLRQHRTARAAAGSAGR